jgi:peptidoglycan/xylan/chitin deacetylase (PgdA/CDA1 family)
VRLRPGYLAMRAYTRARIARGRLTGRGRGWRGVRILGYHRISDDPGVLSVRPERFRAQLHIALESGATPIRLDAALDLLAAPVDDRYFCVTFDDGYRDNLENALPVLRELVIPGTIYVPTRIVDGSASYTWFRRQAPPALTWDELRAIVAEGLVDAQSHTRTHPWLPRVVDEQAREEIAGSAADLEQQLGYRPTSFCYPAGLYGPRETALVRAAGYRAGVTSDPGVNAGGTTLETLRRTLVYWEDTDADFRAKFDGLLDRPPLLRAWLYRRRARG